MNCVCAFKFVVLFLSMLTEQPEGPPESFDGLSTEELLSHENWKARKEGYERLLADVSNQKFSDFGVVPGFLKETNISAFESVIELIHGIFTEHPSSLSVTDVIVPICERGLVGRPKVASTSKAIILCIAANGFHVAAAQALLKVSTKNTKLKLITLELFSELTEAHGVPAECNAIVPLAFKLVNDTDGKVRKEALQLVITLRRSVGPSINGHIDKLRDVQKVEIHKAVDELPPLKVKKPKSALSPVKQEPEFKPSKTEEIKACDEPVDVLGRLPANFCNSVCDTSKKWQERNKALQEVLIPLISFEKVKDGDYSHLVRSLRALLTDSQLPLQLVGVRCVGYLCNSLQERFQPYLRMIVAPLIEKFKEKKTLYLDAVRQTLHIINKHACGINDIASELEASLSSKVPQQRLNTLLWLTDAVRNDSGDRNTQWLRNRGHSVIQKLMRDDKNDVRDAASKLFGVVMNGSEKAPESFPRSDLSVEASSAPMVKSPSVKKQRTSLHGSVPAQKPEPSAHVTPVRSRAPSYARVNVRSKDRLSTPEKSTNSVTDRTSVTSRITTNEDRLSEFGGAKDRVFTRIRSSGVLQKMTESKDWKERMDAIRAIQKMITNASGEVVSIDASQVLLALKSRLTDSNKNIVAEAALCIRVVVSTLGEAARNFTKFIVSAVVPLLKDQKPIIQENAMALLQLIVNIAGFDGLQPALPWGLQTDSNVTTERLCDLILLAAESPMGLPHRALLSSAPAILKGLVSRSHTLRSSVEKLLPHLVANTGYDALYRATCDCKNTDQQTILSALKKLNSGREQHGTPSRLEQALYELPPISTPQRQAAQRQQNSESASKRDIPTPGVSTEQAFPHQQLPNIYSTPQAKKPIDDEPIGRLSAKFEQNLVVSGTEGRVYRRGTPAKMTFANSPVASKERAQAPASYSLRESCYLIRSGTIELALNQCREWEHSIEKDHPVARNLTGDQCALIIQAIFFRLGVLMDNMEFHGIETAYGLARTIETIMKRQECVRRLDELHIGEIFAVLLERLLDKRIDRHSNLAKMVRVLGFYLIQNSTVDACIVAFVRHLTSATDMYLHIATPHMTQIIEFTCLKCLKRATDRLSREEFRMDKILRAVDEFFQKFPPHAFEGKGDLPVRTLRSVIDELVEIKGTFVKEMCVELGLQDSLVYQFVRMCSATGSNLVGSQETRASTDSTQSATHKPMEKQPAVDHHDESTPKENSSGEHVPSDEVLDGIFTSMRRMTSLESGCRELYELLKKFPKFDITPRLRMVNDTHQRFVSRRLARMYDQEVSSGIISSEFEIQLPNLHEGA